MLPAETPI